MRTPFKGLTGWKVPIIQAPMAGTCDSAIVIAVCNAGGLGSLPCASLSVETIRKEVHNIRAATNNPFNINFFCHSWSKPDTKESEKWLSLLSNYYKEFGIAEPADVATATSVIPFNEEMADLVCELRPPIVSFHFGLPKTPGLLEKVKASGAKIMSSATTVEEAMWLESQGVDAIIAQGLEAGGHRGIFLSSDLTTQVGTFALIPQIVKAVSVPVIAAGGISSPEGVKAALALGASAVQVGTTYLLCHEAKTSPIHRQTLKSEASRTTAVTNVFTGRPARAIVNRLVRDLGPMNQSAPTFPFATPMVAPVRAHAEKNGSGDFSAMWAGQNVSGCREIGAADMTKLLASCLEHE
jgi:nitronate monooxygenase